MAQPVSKENKLVAKYAAKAFGGTFHVREYLHDTEPITVDILWCDDRPAAGIASYSTIGLSDTQTPWGDVEYPTRIELAGACAMSVEFFPNILASAAFRMMRTGEIYHPGAVIEDYVKLYVPSSPLPHLYFTAPFLWADQLTTLDCGTKKVTWLLAMPISDSERAYLREHGDRALERLLEQHGIDIADISRAPVV